MVNNPKKSSKRKDKGDSLRDEVIEVLKEAFGRIQKTQSNLEEMRAQYEQLYKQVIEDKQTSNMLRELMTQQKESLDIKTKQITDIATKLGEQSDRVGEQEKEIKAQKTDLVQYFGLFVAIFTAISIDIQLLEVAQNVWQVSGMILMINTAPLLFFYFIRSIHGSVMNLWRFTLIFSTLFFLGGSLMYVGECTQNVCMLQKIYPIVEKNIIDWFKPDTQQTVPSNKLPTTPVTQ